MNFYKTNHHQDRLFLEISTKYYLANWLASDIDHFVTNFPELIADTDEKKIDKQYKYALSIFNETKILAKGLTGKHKECEIILQKFIAFCIKDCEYIRSLELNDSESTEVNILEGIAAEEDFRKNFKKYLSGNDMELYLVISYSFFTKAILSILGSSKIKEFEVTNNFLKSSKEALKNLNMARAIIDECLLNEDWIEEVIEEFVIMAPKNIKTENMAHYCNLNIQYAELWRELYYVHAAFYEDLIEKGCEFDQLEFDIMNFENNKYIGKINIIAIEICTMILNLMDIKVDEIELFSPRTIKSVTNTIERRCAR